MAIYSDEKRLSLAKWIKYTLFVNVGFFLVLVLFWTVMAGFPAALSHTGANATILIGLNAAAFLFYEQLFRPEDDAGRTAAEALGSLQVLAAIVSLLLILGAIGLAVAPGSAGTPAQHVPPAVTGAPSGSTVVTINPVVTECYQTSTGCVPYPPAPTTPPAGAGIYAGDPVIGGYVFDKTQFSPKEEYNSKAGNYEYNYKSVPLDHSPDIRWTFRDDGVLLFTDNRNGELLRTATWTKSETAAGIAEYRIKRGNLDYRGSFLTPEIFQIHNPDFWNMTRAG
jgi:hypothetical protein